MKFVHAADLHLDSPLRGLTAYDGAPVERVRGATRAALRNLIDLCLRERAAFLLLAGDIFDGDWRDFNTGLFFLKELERLRDAGTRVYLVRGNHDAASEVTRQLTLPPHVHEFGDERAATVVLEEHGVAIHGLSFTRRAMPDSLVPRYPAPLPGAVNIGLLHTSADGRPGHSTYAPCGLDELCQKGYDYWALGHIHAHEVLHAAPWVVFPGNTQGRHMRERGHKGCVLVTVDDEAGHAGERGPIAAVQHVALDVVRWHKIAVPLDEDDGVDELYERSRAALVAARDQADGRLVAARLVVTGAARAHAAVMAERDQLIGELRALTFGWGDAVWLEDVRLRTRPRLDLDELRAGEGFVGELLRAVAAARSSPAALAELGAALGPLGERLGDELGALGVDLADAEQLGEWLGEAEALLATRLVEGDGGGPGARRPA